MKTKQERKPTHQTLNDILIYLHKNGAIFLLNKDLTNIAPQSTDRSVIQEFLKKEKKHYTIIQKTKLHEAWLEALVDSDNIKKLRIISTPVTPKIIETIAHRLTHSTHLEELHLKGHEGNDKPIITALACNTTLKKLALDGAELTNDDISQLAKTTTLTSLTLYKTPPINATTAEDLCNNSTLSYLKLNIDSNSAAVFIRCTKKRYLRVGESSTLTKEDALALLKNPHIDVKLPKKYKEDQDILECRYQQQLVKLQNRVEQYASPLKDTINELISKVQEGKQNNEKIEKLTDILHTCFNFVENRYTTFQRYTSQQLRRFTYSPPTPYWNKVTDIAQNILFWHEIDCLRLTSECYKTLPQVNESIAHFIEKIIAGKQAGESIETLTESLQLTSRFLCGHIKKEEYNRERKELVNKKERSSFWEKINVCLIGIGLLVSGFSLILLPVAIVPLLAVCLVGVGMTATGVGVGFFSPRTRPLLSKKAADTMVENIDRTPLISAS